MINLPAIFIANGSAVLLMFVLLMSQHRSIRYGLLDEKIYRLMVVLTLLLCMAEMLTFLIDGRPGGFYRGLSLGLNSLLYIMNILFAFTWTVYADFKLFEDMKRLKKIYPVLAIPAVLIALLSVVNLFVPVFYRISADNVYSRTSLYLIPFILTYLYLAYGVALIYAYRNKVKKYLFLPAIIFMIPIAICSIFQLLFYGLSLTWLGVSIAMVSLYINVQNEASYVDTLSGVFSRQYLNNYLSAEVQKNTCDGKRLAGIMLDIDRFKSINDRFGHLTGDEAIAAVGRILRSTVAEKGFVSRYAGDEFVVITRIKEEQELTALISDIRKNTEVYNHFEKKPYVIQFSMGCSIFQGRGESVEEFINRMDVAMYEEKKEKIRKSIIPERRAPRQQG